MTKKYLTIAGHHNIFRTFAAATFPKKLSIGFISTHFQNSGILFAPSGEEPKDKDWSFRIF